MSHGLRALPILTLALGLLGTSGCGPAAPPTTGITGGEPNYGANKIPPPEALKTKPGRAPGGTARPPLVR